MDQQLAVFKALSDRNRLRVVMVLSQTGKLCACQISGFLKVAGATASRHMGILLSSGLVKSTKEGRWVFYSLNKKESLVKSILQVLKKQSGEDFYLKADLQWIKQTPFSNLDAECCNT